MTDRKAFDEWWQSSDLRGREPLHAALMAWQAATERAAKVCEAEDVAPTDEPIGVQYCIAAAILRGS